MYNYSAYDFISGLKNKTQDQTCYKALKLKKSSLKKSLAVGLKFFIKEIAVHYKL